MLILLLLCSPKRHFSLLNVVEKNPRRPPLAYLVQAGYEPLTFTNIFPYWIKDASIAPKVG